MDKRAEIHTLGCRLNIADSALLTSRLRDAGYEVRPPGEGEVELIVLNSCTVTGEAAAKSRRMVRRLRKLHPAARIIVTGCAAQLEPEQFSDAGADVVLPNAGKRVIPECGDLISGEGTGEFRENAFSDFPFRSRAFIKIQEGCNNFCTYCIVPYVRGRERSRNLYEVLADCRNAAECGFPEIVLTGVNTCAYQNNSCDLAGLIGKICEIPGDFRIRLSSTEPRMDNFSMIDAMASAGEKVCRFLHLSLQYGNDRILQRMGRRYTAGEYREFVEKARAELPGVHIGTDVIAGFPGESDADFEECAEFVRQMEFANIHVFTYSPRPGTPAADMPDQVEPAAASRRAAILQDIARLSAEKFARSQIGRTLPVIFERSGEGVIRGWSDNYLELTAPAGKYPLGKVVSVETEADMFTLLQEV